MAFILSYLIRGNSDGPRDCYGHLLNMNHGYRWNRIMTKKEMKTTHLCGRHTILIRYEKYYLIKIVTSGACISFIIYGTSSKAAGTHQSKSAILMLFLLAAFSFLFFYFSVDVHILHMCKPKWRGRKCQTSYVLYGRNYLGIKGTEQEHNFWHSTVRRTVKNACVCAWVYVCGGAKGWLESNQIPDI